MGASLLVHVVIPVYGRPDMLARNLDFISRTSIYEQKITVIDDASDSSDYQAILRVLQEHPSVELVRNPKNLGFGQSVNSVLLQSDLEFGLVINSDVVLMKFDVLKQVENMLENQNLAAIGYTTSQGNFNRVTWGLPLNSGLEAISLAIETLGRGILSPIYVLDAALIFIRNSCFQQVGGFDRAYGRGYGEDVDLGFRLIREGFDLACDCGTFFHHTGGASFGLEKKEMLAQAKRQLVKRWGKTWEDYEAYSTNFPHAPYLQNDRPSARNPLPRKVWNEIEKYRL